MSALRTFARQIAAAAAGIGLILVFGCGDDSGLSKRYPVSGTVTYKGEPIAKGTIGFVPTKAEGRAATGEIDNGRYTLTTAVAGDGALPGTYKVTIISQDIDTSELKAVAKGGQFHHDEKFAKATLNAKNLVPARYKLAETSDITKEVKPETNRIDIDLKDE